MTGSNEALLTRAQVLAELERLRDGIRAFIGKAGTGPVANAAFDSYTEAHALVRRLAPEGVDVDALAEAVGRTVAGFPETPPWDWDTYDPNDFEEWESRQEWEGYKRNLFDEFRALILKHVRPVAEHVLVQRCPVCEGTGVVSRPPGVPADLISFTSSSPLGYACPLCAGARVIPLPAAGDASKRRGQAIADWLHDRISLAKLAEELGVNIADVSALEVATRQPCAGCREVLAAALAYRDAPEQNAVAYESARAGLIVAAGAPCTCGQRPSAKRGTA